MTWDLKFMWMLDARMTNYVDNSKVNVLIYLICGIRNQLSECRQKISGEDKNILDIGSSHCLENFLLFTWTMLNSHEVLIDCLNMKDRGAKSNGRNYGDNGAVLQWIQWIISTVSQLHQLIRKAEIEIHDFALCYGNSETQNHTRTNQVNADARNYEDDDSEFWSRTC